MLYLLYASDPQEIIDDSKLETKYAHKFYRNRFRKKYKKAVAEKFINGVIERLKKVRTNGANDYLIKYLTMRSIAHKKLGDFQIFEEETVPIYEREEKRSQLTNKLFKDQYQIFKYQNNSTKASLIAYQNTQRGDAPYPSIMQNNQHTLNKFICNPQLKNLIKGFKDRDDLNQLDRSADSQFLLFDLGHISINSSEQPFSGLLSKLDLNISVFRLFKLCDPSKPQTEMNWDTKIELMKFLMEQGIEWHHIAREVKDDAVLFTIENQDQYEQIVQKLGDNYTVTPLGGNMEYSISFAPIEMEKREREVTQIIEAISHLTQKLENTHLLMKWLQNMLNLPQEKLNKTDLFVRALLREILSSLRFIDVLPQNFDQQALLFAFINDLIFIMVTYIKPYTYDDFQSAMQMSIGSRLPKDLKITHYAAASGMDAFWMGYIASIADDEMKINHLRAIEIVPLNRDFLGQEIYYEIGKVIRPINNEIARTLFRDDLEKKEREKKERDKYDPLDLYEIAEFFKTHPIPESPILMTGVLSVMPSLYNDATPNFQNVVQRCKDAIRDATTTNPEQYITLLVDRTLEWPEDDPINKVIQELAPELEAGQINIILCKSFQKHLSLGTSKCKTGGVTLINNGDPKFNRCAAYLDKFSRENFDQNDEWQFMTHLLLRNPNGEMEFLRKSSENAKILANAINESFSQNGSPLSEYDKAYNYGPFVFLSFGFQYPMAKNIPFADTFGLPFTTGSKIGHYLRISCGLEPLIGNLVIEKPAAMVAE